MKLSKLLVGLFSLMCVLILTSCGKEAGLESGEFSGDPETKSPIVPWSAVNVRDASAIEPGGVYVIRGTYSGILPEGGGRADNPAELYVSGTWEICEDLKLPEYTTVYVVLGGTIENTGYRVTGPVGCNVTIYSGGKFDFSESGSVFSFTDQADGFFTNNGVMNVETMEMGYSSLLNNALAMATIKNYTYPLTPGGTLNYGTLIMDGEVKGIGIVVPQNNSGTFLDIVVPINIESPEELSMINELVLGSPLFSILEKSVQLLETVGLGIFPDREISVTAFGVEDGLLITNIGLDISLWEFSFTQTAINAAMTETSTNVLVQVVIIDELLSVTLSINLVYNK